MSGLIRRWDACQAGDPYDDEHHPPEDVCRPNRYRDRPEQNLPGWVTIADELADARRCEGEAMAEQDRIGRDEWWAEWRRE